MKALSVRQPWASLIASGRKTIELRTWASRYRGPLLICASTGRTPSPDGRAAIAREGLVSRELPRGVALCVVDLVDVRPAIAGDDDAAGCAPTERDHAWLIANVRHVRPFRVVGRLMTFDVPDDSIEVVAAPPTVTAARIQPPLPFAPARRTQTRPSFASSIPSRSYR